VAENQTVGFTPFHASADDVCSGTFSDQWLVGYCQFWVDNNCLELYSLLVERGNPELACKDLNACPSSTTPQGGDKIEVLAEREEEEFDYSFVVLSDTHMGQGSYTTYTNWLTTVSIDKVNSLVESEKIRFVFITGDITDSAMPYQWKEAKREFDRLKVPYFPLIGNHDQWSYNSTFEEPTPTGDRQFAKLFSDRFSNPKLEGAKILYNNQSTWNPEQNITSWFQNYQLDYQGFTFLALDWNSREHAPRALGYKGSLPLAELHDFPGGTFPWLHDRIATLVNSKQQIVLLQHHPFAMPEFVPEMIYSFPEYSKDRILQELSVLKDSYWGVVAGHLHVWFSGVRSDKQWLSEAVKVGSAISLVHVKDSSIQHITKLFGYDY